MKTLQYSGDRKLKDLHEQWMRVTLNRNYENKLDMNLLDRMSMRCMAVDNTDKPQKNIGCTKTSQKLDLKKEPMLKGYKHYQRLDGGSNGSTVYTCFGLITNGSIPATTTNKILLESLKKHLIPYKLLR
eukprot:TRINITY_DN9952_c1_g2_i2.p1 TRINITY_DN9952_c1_g2~~TRINITY_DN9952_c1_g2_i2.p1  ORF type:complete len:129 (-),score=13.92 TRINITY_DN9952_c1_g2_i2:209-595(-)